MNQYDVAGLLKTYSEKAQYARNTEALKKVIDDLKSRLLYADVRKAKVEDTEWNRGVMMGIVGNIYDNPERLGVE